jgi:hypothetical protein
MSEQKTAEVHAIIKIGDELVKTTTSIATTSDEVGPAQGSDVIRKGAAGLETLADCAGELTHAIAVIRGAPYQMCVVNALNAADALRRAHLWRNDVMSATYYSSAILICAPYIRCTAG